VREFKRAWEAKDIDALVDLLDPDAVAVADSGGLVTAIAEPVGGSERVARACIDVAYKVPGMTLLERTVNGQPGLVAQLDGVTVAVFAFEVADDRIMHLWGVRNPEKLRLWTAGTA
ncbi:MAG: RNA polymerase subunit sigma-24, partial [Actinoallomurus sp.]